MREENMFSDVHMLVRIGRARVQTTKSKRSAGGGSCVSVSQHFLIASVKEGLTLPEIQSLIQGAHQDNVKNCILIVDTKNSDKDTNTNTGPSLLVETSEFGNLLTSIKEGKITETDDLPFPNNCGLSWTIRDDGMTVMKSAAGDEELFFTREEIIAFFDGAKNGEFDHFVADSCTTEHHA
jgi:hypothetical protein